MGQESAAQPLIDLRDKIADASRKFLAFDVSLPSKSTSGKPIPTAASLGWAIPSASKSTPAKKPATKKPVLKISPRKN